MKKAIRLVAMLVLSSTLLFGQEQTFDGINKKDRAVENLINGISSENEGLQRTSIYFAGKYKVQEAVPELVNQFRNNDNPEIRYFAALVIYKIGDEEGLEIVKNQFASEKSKRVKNLCASIILEEMEAEMLAKK